MDETQVAALVRLREISTILDIPIDGFRSRHIPCDLLAIDECLRRWSHLKTAKGRRQALEALRRIVDDEAA